MHSAIRKMGNSSAIIIPKPFLNEIGAEIGEIIDIRVENGQIIITPLNIYPRSSWAKDAKNIARTETTDSYWADFSNSDDANLAW
jgi:antitoxin MazE